MVFLVAASVVKGTRPWIRAHMAIWKFPNKKMSGTFRDMYLVSVLMLVLLQVRAGFPAAHGALPRDVPPLPLPRHQHRPRRLHLLHCVSRTGEVINPSGSVVILNVFSTLHNRVGK